MSPRCGASKGCSPVKPAAVPRIRTRTCCPRRAGGVQRAGDTPHGAPRGTRPRALLARAPGLPSAAPAALARPVEGVPGGCSAIAAGEPQVYAATSEAFVAQMLNLDLLNAIAFDKGCYTGQEVIARAHYRGRVKRRMQRFVTEAPAAPLQPGDSRSARRWPRVSRGAGRAAPGRSLRVSGREHAGRA